MLLFVTFRFETNVVVHSLVVMAFEWFVLTGFVKQTLFKFLLFLMIFLNDFLPSYFC